MSGAINTDRIIPDLELTAKFVGYYVLSQFATARRKFPKRAVFIAVSDYHPEIRISFRVTNRWLIETGIKMIDLYLSGLC